jgi:hypothetical protein
MSEPIETHEEEDTGSRRMDPELKCMSALVRTLNEIAEPARGRVVRWLMDRYTSELA